MQLILTQDVDNLGAMGNMVNVKDGFARNYLIPRGYGILANSKNKAVLEKQLKEIAVKKAALHATHQQVASKLEGVSVTVSKQVGENEKIFGSVTTAEIAELLKAEGLDIPKKSITIVDDIKSVGVFNAEAKLSSEVTAKFKVWVVAQ